MNNDQKMLAEIEELKRLLDAMDARAGFWLAAMQFVAEQDTVGEQLGQSKHERLADIVIAFVRSEIERGGFGPDRDSEDYIADGTLPWSAACEIMDDIGIDADNILAQYVEEMQRGMQNVIRMVGMEGLPGMTPTFAGQPITQEMADEISNGRFGEEFNQQFADKYVLHVMHGDRPCQHPFDSINEAIEIGSADLRRNAITAIGVLTRNGEVVLDTEEVYKRVSMINAAGMN